MANHKGRVGQRLEVEMRVLAIFALSFLMGSSPLAAQPVSVGIIAPTIMAFSSCLEDAIKKGAIAKSGEGLVFTCSGSRAKYFYDYLGELGIQATSEDIAKRGSFRTRYFKDQHDGNQCYLQVEDASGISTSIYTCTLFYAVGPLLNR